MKNLLSIFFVLISFSASSQAPLITYQDKDKTAPTSSEQRNFRDVDANEIKTVVNQHAALIDLKAPISSPTFTGTVGGITKSMVGLGNVDNTSDANKPVSTATQTALNLKANLASFAFKIEPSGTVNGINAVFVLPQTPYSGSDCVFVNGILMTEGEDYEISGATITFYVAPDTGARIRVNYIIQ